MFDQQSSHKIVHEVILTGNKAETISVLTEELRFHGQEPVRLVLFNTEDSPRWISEKELNWYRTGRLDKRKP